MAVLRCPYCGEIISTGSQYCSHCGKQIDKPVVDQYWSGRVEGLNIFLKIAGVVLLWFIIGQFISMALYTVNHWIVISITSLITLIIVLVIHMLRK